MLRHLNETAVILENEDKIRSLCSDIIACAKSSGEDETVNLCKNKLRQLQNEKALKAKVPSETCCTDLGQMAESLCTSAGILLSDIGKNLSVNAKCVFICCEPEIIIDAVMNLISNAAKFSSDRDISVSVASQGSFAVLTAENKISSLADMNFKNGLRCVSNAAAIHGGRFVFAAAKGRAKAVISLPHKKESENFYRTPPFSALLENTFSPVYIGLSDVGI